MSYNIDSVETPVLDAWMTARDVKRLLREHKDQLPEACFLDEMAKRADALLEEGLPDATVPLPNFWWRGVRSGRTTDTLKEVVAPQIRGRVEAIFTWEGGDSHSGLIIHDGVVTECDVVMALRPRQK